MSNFGINSIEQKIWNRRAIDGKYSGCLSKAVVTREFLSEIRAPNSANDIRSPKLSAQRGIQSTQSLTGLESNVLRLSMVVTAGGTQSKVICD